MADNDIETQVRAKATERGLDPDWVATLASRESNYNPQAVSEKGAMGVMQVMPATAGDLRPRFGDNNIAQGVGFLGDQWDTFAAVPDETQRRHFAAAAYNWGPERVMKAMEKAKAGGLDPYDIGSIANDLPEETANYIADINERLTALRSQQQPEGAAAPSPAPQAPAEPPQSLVQPSAPEPRTLQPVSWQQALLESLGEQGDRAGAAGMEVLKGLVTGQLTNPEWLQQGGVEDIGAAVGPALTGLPGMVGGLAAETASRARPDLVPLEPETAATAGQIAPGAARMIPGLVRGVARTLSPSLRAGERTAGTLAARGTEQAAAEASRTAQLGERAAAGTEVPAIVERMGTRLSKTASRKQKALQQLESQAPSGLVGPTGQPIASMSEAQYTRQLANLRKVDETAGKAATDFNQNVRRVLRNTEPKAIAETLADPDIGKALLAHATPAEADILNRAIAAGKPLSDLPYTAEELASLASDIGSGRGVLGTLVREAGWTSLVGAGYAAGGAVGGGGIMATRLALKGLDAALGTKPVVASMRALARLQPGTPEALRILANAGARVGGPQRLEGGAEDR